MNAHAKIVRGCAFAVPFVASILALLPPAAQAAFPDRPIRLILPYAGGAASDMLTRELGAGLQAEFGVAVITENKPGGGTVVGAGYAAKQPADGYTILMIGPATHVIAPAIQPNIPYDAGKDFDLIGMWAVVGSMISVQPSLPVNTLKELVDYSKKNPGKLYYSSAGIGTGPHLSAEAFREMTGASLTHVPYKGAAPATLALLAGEVQVSFVNIPPQVPHVKAGKIRPLAVSSAKRSMLLPDVPTTAEAGLPAYISESWNGLAVPAGTPAAVRARLEQAMFKVGADPARRDRMAAGGAEIRLMGTGETAEYIKAEKLRVEPVIRKLELKPE